MSINSISSYPGANRTDTSPDNRDPEILLPEVPGSPYVLGHGKALVRGKIVAYTGAFPDALEIDSIAIIVPGLGGRKRTSRRLRNALAEAGVACISYEPVRDSNAGIQENLIDPHLLHAQTIDAILTDIRANKQLQSKIPNGNLIDYSSSLLLPHSMGAPPAVGYALDHSTSVDAIIFLQGIGFRSPTPLKLGSSVVKGGVKAVIQEGIPFISRDAICFSPINLARTALHYALRPDRTLGEVISCFSTNLEEPVRTLGALGVQTVYLKNSDDILVPDPSGLEGSVGHVVDIHGLGHFAVQVYSQQTAEAIIKIYKDLASAA